MGLARIITRLSSGYDEIERDLRARGFQVERSSPDEAAAQPADLEITIEECTAEQALIRAMDGGGDASVFVAPGALPGAAQPLAAIPFIPSIQPAISAIQPEIGRTFVVANPATTESAAELQSAEMIAPQPIWGTDTAIGDLAQNAETHEDALAMENEESVQPEMISSQTQVNEGNLLTTSQETHEQGIEASPLPGIQVDSDIAAQAQAEIAKEAVVGALESRLRPELSEPHHESLEAQPVEQFTDFESAAGIEPQTDETPLDQDVETEPVQEPVFAASDTVIIPELEPVIPALTQEAGAAAGPVELHSDGGAMDAGAQTVPSDWPIWQPLADPAAPVQVVQSAMSEAEVPPQMMVQQAELPSTAPAYPRSRTPIPYRVHLQAYRAALKRLSMDDTLFWKTATLAAIVAAAAMLVAVSFHRFSPIPATLDNSTAQGSGEVQAPAAVLKGKHPTISGPAAVKTVAAESLVEAKPPVLVEASHVSNASAARKVGLAASKQKIETKPQRSFYESDVIARDTVVRYGATRASLPSPSAKKKSQVNRYSDMN
jgi:hypothetical protein